MTKESNILSLSFDHYKHYFYSTAALPAPFQQEFFFVHKTKMDRNYFNLTAMPEEICHSRIIVNQINKQDMIYLVHICSKNQRFFGMPESFAF